MARSTDVSLAWSTDPIFLESQRDYHGGVGLHEVTAMGPYHHQHASVVWVSFELTWRCLVSRKGKTATVHAGGSCVSIEVSLSSAPRAPARRPSRWPRPSSASALFCHAARSRWGRSSSASAWSAASPFPSNVPPAKCSGTGENSLHLTFRLSSVGKRNFGFPSSRELTTQNEPPLNELDGDS